MNKRQAKKKIPRDIPYCYKIREITRNENGMPTIHVDKCPHYKIIRNTKQRDMLCKKYCHDYKGEYCNNNDCYNFNCIVVCSYCHENTITDCLLTDSVKVCGE